MGDHKVCCKRCAPASFSEVLECTTDRAVAAELYRKTALGDLSVMELIDKHKIQPPYTFAITCSRPRCDFRRQVLFDKTHFVVTPNMQVTDVVDENAANAVSMVERGTCLCTELSDSDGSDSDTTAGSDEGFTVTLLHLAAAVGNAELLRVLATRGHVDCLIVGHMTTPLQIAACHIQEDTAVDLVKILLDAGADVNYTTNNNFPLLGAIRTALVLRHFSALKLLLHHGARVQSPCDEFLTAALVRDNWELAQILLDGGGQLKDASIRIRNDRSLLHILVTSTCPDELLDRILKKWKDMGMTQPEIVEQIDANGRTPIFLCLDRLERVKLLLSHGANANQESESSFTPIIESVFQDTEVATVECLLAAGADPKACSKPEGYTALHFAAWEGKLSILRCLVEHGCSHDCPTMADRNTPLALAAHGNHVAVIRYLLSLGCDVNNADRDMDTPLIYCTFNSCLEGAELLLAHGADPDMESVHRATPLWNAVYQGAWPLVRRFIQENVRLDVPSAGVQQHAASDNIVNIYDNPRTPMELAFKRCHSTILAVLAIATCCLSGEQWLWKVYLEGRPPEMLHLHQWLCKLASQTPSLKALCRRRMRQLLGRPLVTKVEPLTIPVMLKSYLLFEELLPQKLSQVGNRSFCSDLDEWTEQLEKLL